MVYIEGTLGAEGRLREGYEDTMQHNTITYPAVFGVRLSREQAARLRQLAQADDRPVSAVLRRLVAETLEQQDQQEAAGVR